MKSVDPEPMDVEDLAAIESISEDTIMQQLESRYRKGQYYTYVGEILMFLNPNKPLNIYGFQVGTDANNELKDKGIHDRKVRIV